MIKFKCDFRVENFDRFFEYKVKNSTTEQRERLPFSIGQRLFRKDGTLTTSRLNFLQQLYILSQGIDSEIFLLVKNKDTGLGVVEFEKFQKNIKQRKYTQDESDDYFGKGIMVLAGKDVIDWMSHINGVSLSAPYNFALRMANTRDQKMPAHEKELVYFAKMISTYEGNKKRIIKDRQLSMPEWYILLYLCDGKERSATNVYEEVYAGALNASRAPILASFKKLVMRGYIQIFGKGKATTYSITPIGKAEIKTVIKKYIIP